MQFFSQFFFQKTHNQKKIQVTFYDGKNLSTSTDISLLAERKETFNKLRRN
jgi:hypothetical protein